MYLFLRKINSNEDLGIQIFDADNDGDQDIYIASGGNEYKDGSQGYEDRFL